ncbi:radical SAM protein [Oscillospiraceae bacterium WX1]
MTPRRRVIPFFVPHLGCQNSCVFCNQRRITGSAEPVAAETVTASLRALALPEDAACQIAFYGGSFTAIPVEQQLSLLRAVQPFLTTHKNATLRLSTRPDAVDRQTLERLRVFGVRTIELGAQSLCDDVLQASCRGHTSADTEKAARLVREQGFELILQMMTGLPGDTPEKARWTAERLIALRPDGVRIYPTVILQNTPLFDMWRTGMYDEHTVDDAVVLCAELYQLFEASGIPVIRIGLNPTAALSGGAAVGGAYHPAFGQLVFSRIYYDKALALLQCARGAQSVTLGVHPACVSYMTGQRRASVTALEKTLHIGRVRALAADVERGEIVIMRIDYGG